MVSDLLFSNSYRKNGHSLLFGLDIIKPNLIRYICTCYHCNLSETSEMKYECQVCILNVFLDFICIKDYGVSI